MRPASKILVALVLIVGLAGCREQTLYSGLAQREANEMMALLKRAGIDAQLTLEARNGTLTVAVPKTHAVASVEMLSRAGYPRQKTPTMTDLLPKDTWLLSPVEERAKLSYALSQEMTGTLRQINGISDVRVHFAAADRNALGQITAQPSAGVVVRYDADVIGPDFADSIRNLVASSVAGLTYDRVSVLMVPQDPMSMGGSRLAAQAVAAVAPGAGRDTTPGPTAAWADWLNASGTKLVAAGILAAALASIFFRVLRGSR
jgi:type III secretion protein J